MLTQGWRGPNAQGIGLDVTPPTQSPKILVLEDEKDIQSLVTAMLKIRGFTCDITGTVADARARMAATRYDVMLVDVQLPDGSGLALAELGGPEAPLAIVMTGSSDIQTAVQAIRNGAIDFITKPFSVGHFLQRIDKAIEEWRTRRSLQYYARALETLVELKTEELSRTSRQIDEVCDMTVAALGAALNLKDHETADHCARVSGNSVTLGSLLNLSDFELKNLKWGAYLHDVGKIGIPERVLLKEGDLAPEERRIVEKHPIMGHAMIRNIDFLGYATDVVLSHHERFDGTGYPHGLKQERIPLNARIFALMDTMDAMTSDRPYRAALPIAAVAAELEDKAGSQFDPEIVEAFLAAPASTWHTQGWMAPSRESKTSRDERIHTGSGPEGRR
ncbi:MAG: HD domain-containing phosphohydrolase [Spirochaetia bacterium]|jgi:response regulator RpfG family c-di-GMP phosphodiesterase